MSSSPTTSSPSLAVAALDVFCGQCGYNLRASTAERCPECGVAIDRATLSGSTLPWRYRRYHGRWRAYWRTVRRVRRLDRQCVKEPDGHDPRQQRMETVSTARTNAQVQVDLRRRQCTKDETVHFGNIRVSGRAASRRPGQLCRPRARRNPSSFHGAVIQLSFKLPIEMNSESLRAD